MRIGELAKQLGIATSKIRFLESRGLVHSSRLPNGYRDYDQESFLTLQTVLQAQSFGFTLEEISSAFLEIQGRSLRCDYIVQRLLGKIQQLDQHIAQVETLRSRIRAAAADEMQARQLARRAKDRSPIGRDKSSRDSHAKYPQVPA
jgi:MerR family transcriptional regulator, copper efflux regulator